MSDPARAERRLENIQAVEPILSALRTVSQGSIQAARKRLTAVRKYEKELLEISDWIPDGAALSHPEHKTSESRALFLALGSDRGLCARFNRDTAERLRRERNQFKKTGKKIEVWSLGLRLTTGLEQIGIRPDFEERFARRAVPEFEQADRLAGRMRDSFRKGRYQEVFVFYNRESKPGQYQRITERLLPREIDRNSEKDQKEIWPPPIVETSPESLLKQLLDQLVVINLYVLMLASSAAEHNVRFHILEDAAQNTERLMEELQMEVQRARQEAITTEMVELAAAAGLTNK